MLSDFSTLTDFRDLGSALDLELFTSMSSVMGLSLRSAGVRERFLELFDDLEVGGPMSLLRLERERTEAGEGEMEQRLLCEREEREVCFSDSRLR